LVAGADLNRRPLGYEPSTLSLIWRNLTPFWAEKALRIGPNFGPKFSDAVIVVAADDLDLIRWWQKLERFCEIKRGNNLRQT
jgi:hypothetical protein